MHHDKIKNYIPYETRISEFKESHYIQVQISQPMNSETKYITMNISYDEPWEDIKSSIDAHLKCILTRDCPLCFVTDKDRLFRVSCKKCAFFWCNGCYRKMIYKSQRYNHESRCIYNIDMPCPFCHSLVEYTHFMELMDCKKDAN